MTMNPMDIDFFSANPEVESCGSIFSEDFFSGAPAGDAFEAPALKPKKFLADFTPLTEELLDPVWEEAPSRSPDLSPCVSRRKDLERVRFSVPVMERLAHLPFFAWTAKGTFVRRQVTTSKYKIFEIVDFCRSGFEHVFGTAGTKLGVELRHGSERFRTSLGLFSDRAFTKKEFKEFMDNSKAAGVTLPTLDAVRRKERDMARLMQHKFHEDDLELLVTNIERLEKLKRITSLSRHKAGLASRLTCAKKFNKWILVDEDIFEEIDDVIKVSGFYRALHSRVRPPVAVPPLPEVAPPRVAHKRKANFEWDSDKDFNPFIRVNKKTRVSAPKFRGRYLY